MIIVKVELWPGGDESRASTLATALIANTGDHHNHPCHGNYTARFKGKNGRLLRREALVTNHPRLRQPVLSLVRKVLQVAGY